MSDLVFNLDSSYEYNIEAFRLHVTAIDPAMADILFKHLDKLMTGEDPGSRSNRTAFNHAVLADLEASTDGEAS